MCNLEIIGACLCTGCFIFSQNIICLLCLNTETNVNSGSLLLSVSAGPQSELNV